MLHDMLQRQFWVFRSVKPFVLEIGSAPNNGYLTVLWDSHTNCTCTTNPKILRERKIVVGNVKEFVFDVMKMPYLSWSVTRTEQALPVVMSWLANDSVYP